ncbi:zinc finger, CCHC-type containing protein [Tanacetum coccineum]
MMTALIPNGTKDIGGSVVLEEVTKEEQGMRSLTNTPIALMLRMTPKTFDEGMKSQDVAFWKEAINDEMDSIMGNNTWVLADLPLGCKPLGCKWIFKRKLKVDLTKEFLSSRFSMKDMGEADVILGIRIKHESNGIAISQSYYIKKVLKKLNYFDCTLVSTPIDISEKLIWMLDVCHELYKAFCCGWISNFEDNSSTSGWVFLLGGGAISWASKKQTYITGSIMESEFVALAAVGKEAKWLRNLILEILLWSKSIAPISISCDSASTLAKAYSQMYNRKSRHLGVSYSMICELIMNEVVSIEFVRSHQNLADHLTKVLARDLVIKSAEGMGLKSN